MSAASRTPRTTATKRRAAQLTVGAAVAALALTACGSGGTSGGGNNTNFVTGSGGIATVKKGERHNAPSLTGKDVQFLGINTRDTSTGPAKKFEENYDVPYPSFYDPTGRLLLRFDKGTLNPQAIPSTIVVDREGKIAARSLKPLSEKALRKMVAPVVAEK
jgi:hypothetical protein